jgi:signal transduction histidine kinase
MPGARNGCPSPAREEAATRKAAVDACTFGTHSGAGKAPVGKLFWVTRIDEPFAHQPLSTPAPAAASGVGGDRDVLRRFLQAAAHELRTPVTTLKGTAQLARRRLAKGDVDPARLDRALETIDAEADRLSRLINQLLEAARIADGDLDFGESAVDIELLVTSILRKLPPSLAGTRVELRAPGERVLVQGDSEHLLLAVSSLIENAARYAPGEPLIIDLAPSWEGETEGPLQSGPMVALSVITPMPGVPRADMDLLVDRVQAEQHAASAGAGIGLFLCRQIVELHGGRVETARVDGGTRMTALLPASRLA